MNSLDKTLFLSCNGCYIFIASPWKTYYNLFSLFIFGAFYRIGYGQKRFLLLVSFLLWQHPEGFQHSFFKAVKFFKPCLFFIIFLSLLLLQHSSMFLEYNSSKNKVDKPTSAPFPHSWGAYTLCCAQCVRLDIIPFPRVPILFFYHSILY